MVIFERKIEISIPKVQFRAVQRRYAAEIEADFNSKGPIQSTGLRLPRGVQFEISIPKVQFRVVQASSFPAQLFNFNSKGPIQRG